MHNLLRVSLLLFTAMMAVGCGRSTAPEKANPAPGERFAAGDNPFAPQPAPVVAVEPPSVMAQRYEEQMFSTDGALRSQGAQSLGNMGEPGLPALMRGMRSQNADVRLASVAAIPLGTMLEHKNQTLPMLVGLLTDRDPRVRRGAISRLLSFGKDGQLALPELLRVAKTDPSPEVRQFAAQTADRIDQLAKNGKVYAGSK